MNSIKSVSSGNAESAVAIEAISEKASYVTSKMDTLNHYINFMEERLNTFINTSRQIADIANQTEMLNAIRDVIDSKDIIDRHIDVMSSAITNISASIQEITANTEEIPESAIRYYWR